MKSLPSLDHLTGKISCEDKNDQIYKFEGTFNNPSLKAALSADNLLLRGSSLRNTEWVIGCVVYAGHDSKIIMNSNNSTYKLSSIEKKTNRQILLIFVLDIVLCSLAATYGTVLNFTSTFEYLEPSDSWNRQPVLYFIKTFGSWILLFS